MATGPLKHAEVGEDDSEDEPHSGTDGEFDGGLFRCEEG